MEGDLSVHKTVHFIGNYFNPLPPHGGRHFALKMSFAVMLFQSTPSAWRETSGHCPNCRSNRFQSTPSAWRETRLFYPSVLSKKYFNPLPPHGGRPMISIIVTYHMCISIHSLRMEGDRKRSAIYQHSTIFQSTPSAWRETAPS